MWLVAWYEYKRHVLRKRFLFALLSMPLMAVVVIGVGFLAVALEMNNQPVGYVEAPQIFSTLVDVPREETGGLFPPVDIYHYATEEEARAALDASQIQAYFVLDENYMNNGQVRMVAQDKTGSNAQDDFESTLRYNLLLNQPADIAKRLVSGSNMTVESADGSREMNENNILGIILPMLAGLLFVIVVNISGGYLLQAVVEEKENRTMEIVVTSVSPEELMAGKTIGNLGVGLTQLVIWIAFGVIALLFAGQIWPDIGSMQFGGDYLWLMVLTLLPAFVMVGAMMATLGATATETREAQQIAGLFTLPIVIPYWFVAPMMTSPNGPLAVGFSLFPLTAPVALPLRAAFATVPFWQIGLSIGLLFACAVAALWISGRAFRLGMLRYGKRLRFAELFARKVR